MSWAAGLRMAIGTLSVLPARVDRVDREVAGRAMVLAPAVGLLLGLIAAVPLWFLPGLLGAALALGALAVLTRGLHLDGLADLADGLGSGKPADAALNIMKKSDIGPFGVMSLVFVILIQASSLATLGPIQAPIALVIAVVTGRLALTWACREGVPAARPDGLGVMVAGTVRRGQALLATLIALVCVFGLGLLSSVIATPTAPVTASSGTVAKSAGPATSHSPSVAQVPDLATFTKSATSTELATSGTELPTANTAPIGALVGPTGPSTAPIGTGAGLMSASAGPIGTSAGLMSALTGLVAALAGIAAALLLLRHARRRLGGITGDVLGALVEAATTATLFVYATLS